MLPSTSSINKIPYLSVCFRHSAKKRHYCQKPIDKIIKHEFDIQEAAREFVEADKKRFLTKTVKELTPGLVPVGNEPLKKCYLPFFLFTTVVNKTKYTAEFGIERVTVHTDSKGRVSYRTTIDWYPTRGSIKPFMLDLDNNRMHVYAGFQYSESDAEEAIEGYLLSKELQVFDSKDLENDIIVDRFLKRAGMARKVALERIEACVSGQIVSDVQTKHCVYHVSSIRFNLDVETLKFESALLPFYALKYNLSPARLMFAIKDRRIIGSPPLSGIKVTALGVALTALTSVFFPMLSVPARLMLLGAGGALGNSYALYRDTLIDKWQQRSLRNQREENDNVAETPRDRLRRKATKKSSKVEEGQIIHADQKYFEMLGLNPNEPLTQEMLKIAFHKRIKVAHPDVSGNASEAADVIKARTILSEKFKSNPFKDGQKRSYSTSIKKAEIRKPPSSLYDASARKLIDAVLVEKNYKKAKYLVEVEEVHPDSHDKGENTLLSEAAKQGNVEAIRFAINELGASPDASCDCPCHNTALHYGAERKDAAVVQILLEKGATPNLINSLGMTPLDVAIQSENREAVKLLRSSGGVENAPQMSFSRKVFGYGSDERTMLLKQKNDLDQLAKKGNTE